MTSMKAKFTSLLNKKIKESHFVLQVNEATDTNKDNLFISHFGFVKESLCEDQTLQIYSKQPQLMS